MLNSIKLSTSATNSTANGLITTLAEAITTASPFISSVKTVSTSTKRLDSIDSHDLAYKNQKPQHEVHSARINPASSHKTAQEKKVAVKGIMAQHRKHKDAFCNGIINRSNNIKKLGVNALELNNPGMEKIIKNCHINLDLPNPQHQSKSSTEISKKTPPNGSKHINKRMKKYCKEVKKTIKSLDEIGGKRARVAKRGLQSEKEFCNKKEVKRSAVAPSATPTPTANSRDVESQLLKKLVQKCQLKFFISPIPGEMLLRSIVCRSIDNQIAHVRSERKEP